MKTIECVCTYDGKHDAKTQMDQTNAKYFDTQSRIQECPNKMTHITCKHKTKIYRLIYNEN